MHPGLKIGIIIVVITLGIGLASPLFYETEVDEPLPIVLDKIEPGMTLDKFSNMDDTSRQEIVKKMSDPVKEKVMMEAAKTSSLVSEEMVNSNQPTLEILKTGSFEGLVGHQASGVAKIIQTGQTTHLRFEDFEVTNGPDLRVYLTEGGDIKNGIHLEKLKGSRGNQNYLLENIDLQKYNTVVIYCQPFGVYFGQAELS